MTIRESLQTITALKQEQQEKESKKEQDLKELEQIKKDIILLIEELASEWLNTGIDNFNDCLLYYFNYEQEINEQVYYMLLDRYTIKKEIPNTFYIDSNGFSRSRYEEVSKYKSYNQDTLRELIPKIIVEYLKEQKEHEKQHIKLLKEKQQEEKKAIKENSEANCNLFIRYFLEIYKKQKISINQFIINLNSKEFKQVFFKELQLDLLDYETLRAYNRAVKEFTKEYQEQEEPTKDKPTVAGLSLGAFTIAGVIGFIEALGGKK